MRGLTNLTGNAVATIVVAKWENEFDSSKALLVQPGRAVEVPELIATEE
jgi:aerobic C4-dicarboxylate transport protein